MRFKAFIEQSYTHLSWKSKAIIKNTVSKKSKFQGVTRKTIIYNIACYMERAFGILGLYIWLDSFICDPM